ncbi:methyltransferase domain-containing protein [Pelagibacteraceae bacterium]|nr:methyltransferase domain-containing protein [Pelagibacteraceae bacterium]
MSNFKSLVSGVGNLNKTTKYYDDWSENYDETLKLWNYQAPKKSIKFFKETINKKPKNILDLACGTGLFGTELKKFFPKSHIYGSDISKKSLKITLEKKIYVKLQIKNFEQLHHFKVKFDLISLIGSMTYCKNFDKLFANINKNIKKKGFVLFTHRVDLWKQQNFINILKKHQKTLKILKISRPLNYLPFNKDFKNKIKIKIVLLHKY